MGRGDVRCGARRASCPTPAECVVSVINAFNGVSHIDGKFPDSGLLQFNSKQKYN